MKYEICIITPNAEITIKTDDLNCALCEFIAAYQEIGATHAHIMDATTGEILALYDVESKTLWQSDEITAHITAFISACLLGEALLSPVSDEPATPSLEEFLSGLVVG